MVKVAVIGAGAVGLSTAVNLQRALPGCDVTLIADKTTTETTSDGAAGIFRPTLAKTPGVPKQQLLQWLRDSWEHLSKMAVSEEAPQMGVNIISGWSFTDQQEQQTPLYGETAMHYRKLTEDEMRQLCGNKYKYGFSWTTLICECRYYLPYLTRRFESNGGRFIRRHINSLEELSDYDVVVNCAGLGSREILGDDSVVPIRGHLIRVRAPWIKHFVYTGDKGECYIIPGKEHVMIGGTQQHGRYDVQPRESDHDVIMRRACDIVPSLKDSKVLWDWVGLRPFRKPLRVEKDLVKCSNGKLLKVVHNYGHGGEGVSLSWGTSLHACRLVQEMLKSSVTSRL